MTRSVQKRFPSTTSTLFDGEMGGQIDVATSTSTESRPLGELREGAMFGAELSAPKKTLSEPTTEGGEGVFEGAESEALNILRAKGLMRATSDQTVCVVCEEKLHLEAVYVCTHCSHPVHVRCLSYKQRSEFTDLLSLAQAANSIDWRDVCAKCSGTRPLRLEMHER